MVLFPNAYIVSNCCDSYTTVTINIAGFTTTSDYVYTYTGSTYLIGGVLFKAGNCYFIQSAGNSIAFTGPPSTDFTSTGAKVCNLTPSGVCPECSTVQQYLQFDSCCGDDPIYFQIPFGGFYDGLYEYLGAPVSGLENICYSVTLNEVGVAPILDMMDYSLLPAAPIFTDGVTYSVLSFDDLRCASYVEECPTCVVPCYTLYNCDGEYFNTTVDLSAYVDTLLPIQIYNAGGIIPGSWYVFLNTGKCNNAVDDISVDDVSPAPCVCRCFTVVTDYDVKGRYIDCDGNLQKIISNTSFCSLVVPLIESASEIYELVEGGVCVDGICPILCFELTECTTGEIITSQSQGLSEYFVTGEVLELVGYPGCWQVTSDAAEDCSCAVDLTVTIVHADCPTCLGITAYKLTNCENTSDIKYTYDDLSEYVGQTLRTDCGCYTVELIDFEPTSTSPIVIISSFNSCTECLRQYYKLTDCNGVEDPVYTYTDLSLIIPTPVIGCDCISVTYTLIGGEPVTVEVEKESTQLNGKNFYKFPLIENNISVVWDPIKLWIVVDDSEETQATLSLDTPCPFGTYTIEEFSIFESFEVAPCDSIPVIKIKGCDTCWNVEETNTPINPGIVTVTASFPDCPSCTPPLPCLCNRMTNYDTIQRRYTYTDCDDVENAFILQPGKSSGKICLKKWTVTWPETDNLEVFGDCVLNEDQVTYNCPETRPKRKITPGYSVPTCDIDKYENITCRSSEILYKEVMRLRYGMSNCCPEDDEKWLIKKELIDLAALVDPNYICTPVQTCGCAPSSCGCGCSSTLKTCNSQ
jgi:hypothetical protein